MKIQFFSFLVLGIIVLGLVFRHRRKIHVPAMITAMGVDFGLVLWVELQRHAIEKVVTRSVSPFVLFHASVSAGVLILYGVMAYTGYWQLKHVGQKHPLHRPMASLFVLCRLTNFVTSLWIE